MAALLNRRVRAWQTGGVFRFLDGRPRYVPGGGLVPAGAQVDLLVAELPAVLPCTVQLTAGQLPFTLRWKVTGLACWPWETDPSLRQVRRAVADAGQPGAEAAQEALAAELREVRAIFGRPP